MTSITNVAGKITQLGQKIAATASEAKSAISEALQNVRDQQEAFRGRTSFLGDGRLDKIEKRVSEAMEKWLAQNPGATLAEIKEQAKLAGNRETSIQICDKYGSDNFFANLMSRQKELLADLWS